MDIGVFTDSVPELSLARALDLAVDVGAKAIEIATGGMSTAPHLRLDELLDDPRKRDAFQAEFQRRGLRISALNCPSWLLHPVKGRDAPKFIRDTIILAEHLGVRKIVTMSGTPGDLAGSSAINWIWYPDPLEMQAVLERQWDDAIPLWRELADFASDHGIERLAFELHPVNLVYNAPTLLRLREAVGPIIGANMDPSHLFWQQMDPVRVIRALGPAIYHVHLKDAGLVPDQVDLAGVLDSRPLANPRQRAWNFRTAGREHGAEFWREFVAALRDVGYDDTLSIEHEDVTQAGVDAVVEAADFIRPLLA